MLEELLTTEELARCEERRTTASVSAASIEVRFFPTPLVWILVFTSPPKREYFLRQGFESCRYCSWGAILELAEVDKVFSCGGCGAEYCRLCERDWSLEHLGTRCEELHEDFLAAKRKRLEEALTAAVLRKCHKCGLQFQKVRLPQDQGLWRVWISGCSSGSN